MKSWTRPFTSRVGRIGIGIFRFHFQKPVNVCVFQRKIGAIHLRSKGALLSKLSLRSLFELFDPSLASFIEATAVLIVVSADRPRLPLSLFCRQVAALL